MITRFVHPIVLFHFIISIYLICQFHFIPCDLKEHITKIGIWQYSLKTTTDQSSYQIPIICDLFGLCNSTNLSSRNSPPWNLSSSFVTCTVRDICGANTLFLAVQTLSAVSGESKALFRAIIFNILKKYFGDILQWIKKKLCNTTWPMSLL